MSDKSIDDLKIVASVDVYTGYPPNMVITYNDILNFIHTTKSQIIISETYFNYNLPNFDDWCNMFVEPVELKSNFRFWFYDMESANAFQQMFGGILEIPPVLPTF